MGSEAENRLSYFAIKSINGNEQEERTNSELTRNNRTKDKVDLGSNRRRTTMVHSNLSDFQHSVRSSQTGHGQQGFHHRVNDHMKLRPDLTFGLSSGADRLESRPFWISDRQAYFDQFAKNEEIMAAEREERAINLSAEITPVPRSSSSSSTASRPGSPGAAGRDDKHHFSQGHPASQVNSKYSTPQHSISGASKRKQRTSYTGSGSPDQMSPLMNGNQSALTMAASQNGLSLQQLQQMLLSQQGLVPPQLQQMMQVQQSAMMQQKLQEQALVQLNEQLQLNMLQQTQIAGEKKPNGKQTQQAQLQALALQQHQLMQQMQQMQLPQQQQQFLLACLMQPQQGVVSPEQMHQIWKEATSTGGDDGLKGLQNGLGALVNGTSMAGTNPLLQGSLLGMNGFNSEAFPFPGPMLGQVPLPLKQEDGFDPLYRHGLCKWPGCDAECSDTADFTKHLNSEHNLDDKNTAQARVQMQIVSQLEIQLNREKKLLHAMMHHLHVRPHHDNREDREPERKVTEKQRLSPKLLTVKSEPLSLPVSPSKVVKPPSNLPHLNPNSHGLPPLIIPPPQSTITSATSHGHSLSQPATPTGLGAMRRRVSDKCNLPISAEIQRNRDFYKNTDVRPPFTYASLIRQAIIESDNRQLTLNEVYQWFQNTFAYFRRNEATWKNAVRHNLSLHKCFMRVENVKGAVWTVDEIEFYKRRPQKLTGALSSPSYSADNSPYRDCLDPGIRAVMEQNHIFMNQHMSNGSLSDSGAEDLSVRSHGNSSDSFSKPESPHNYRDVPVFPIKHEPFNYQDNGLSTQDYSQGLDLSPKNGEHSPRSSYHSPKTSQPSPRPASISPRSSTFAYASKEEGMNQDTFYNKQSADADFISKGPFMNQTREVNVDGVEDDMQMSAHDLSIGQSEAMNMKIETNMEENKMELESDKLGEEFQHLEHEIGQLNGEQKDKHGLSEPVNHKLIDSERNSPGSYRESPVNQVLTNQELYSPLLHANQQMPVVTHSMS